MSEASFIKSDSATQGAWHGVYGADGYGIIGDSSSVDNSVIPVTQGYFSYPSYAAVTLASESAYCWASNTGNVVGLEYPPPATNRVVAAWDAASFTIDIQDGSTHRIALYFQDYYHTNQRSETITITDDSTGATLDSRTISNFVNGVWFVWDVSGSVKFTISLVSGDNSVLSGIFFDPSPIRLFRPMLILQRRFEPAFYE